MFSKETFIKNISTITANKKSQAELAEMAGCSPSSMSKYLNPKRQDFPPAEVLYNLAESFHVSVDWLLGRSGSLSSEYISPRKLCETLLLIYNSRLGFSFGECSATEECFIPIEHNGGFSGNAKHEIKTNHYISLYFSEWVDLADEEDYIISNQIGNNRNSARYINTFLSRLRDLNELRKKGGIPDNDMYERLVYSYLNDVPDK